MSRPVNEARGEVALTIEGVELVIAAQMQALATLSTRLKCQSVGELYQRLAGAEPAAVMAGIECLTIRGKSGEALRVLKLRHFPACRTAFTAALAHHMDDEDDAATGAGEGAPGNGDAAGETA